MSLKHGGKGQKGAKRQPRDMWCLREFEELVDEPVEVYEKDISSNANISFGGEDAFPLNARDHGTEMVTVNVGNKCAMQAFSVHKGLLRKASDYFEGALAGSFQEGIGNQLDLPNDCPMAFEVIYQWLYSGEVLRAKFYTQDRIPEDTLWLRVFKMAQYQLVDDVQKVAYGRLRCIFQSQSRYVPSRLYIQELYSKDNPQEFLQEFTVAHTAFWIRNSSRGDYREWEALFSRKKTFGNQVAIQLAKIHTNDYQGSRSHPSDDAEFDDYARAVTTDPRSNQSPSDGCEPSTSKLALREPITNAEE